MTDHRLRAEGGVKRVLKSVFGLTSDVGAKRDLTLDYIRGLVMLLVLWNYTKNMLIFLDIIRIKCYNFS